MTIKALERCARCGFRRDEEHRLPWCDGFELLAVPPEAVAGEDETAALLERLEMAERVFNAIADNRDGWKARAEEAEARNADLEGAHEAAEEMREAVSKYHVALTEAEAKVSRREAALELIIDWYDKELGTVYFPDAVAEYESALAPVSGEPDLDEETRKAIARTEMQMREEQP